MPTGSSAETRGASTPLVAVAIVLAAAAGAWLGASLGKPSPRSAASAELDVAGIEARLDRIETAIERLGSSLGASTLTPVASVERRPANPHSEEAPTDVEPLSQSEIDQVLAAIQRSETELRAELEATRQLVRGEAVREDTLSRIRDEPREIDWYAWDEIIALWDEDPDAARREVKLLTDEEVLDRFGTPTDVWSNAQGITWQYARDYDATTKKYATDIILRIPAGFVTQLAVRKNG